MANAVLETVVEQVKSLTYEEQQELKNMLDEIMLKSEYERKRLVFHRRLMEKGMIREIPHRTKSVEEFDAFKPVEVEGEPMSETIIKERR